MSEMSCSRGSRPHSARAELIVGSDSSAGIARAGTMGSV